MQVDSKLTLRSRTLVAVRKEVAIDSTEGYLPSNVLLHWERPQLGLSLT